jgi:protein-S-isoprenylcysteine O-methyltransferase
MEDAAGLHDDLATTLWRWRSPQLAAFAIVLVFFHGSEFFLARLFNRDLLSARSFLLSGPYCLAMLAGLAEYQAELRLLGLERKTQSAFAHACFAVGVLLVVCGEALRKSAVVTAGRAFTHDIQHERPRVPRVVQRGVYAMARHPGYLGWMLWAPGTQVLLANPICAVCFFFAARRFFANRIPYEEALLRAPHMFGDAYDEYARRTPTWIPGIP